MDGPREKIALDALRYSGPPRDGGRRIGACSNFAWPSGTPDSSAILVTAVPWRIVRRASRRLSHCLCFSFCCRSISRAGVPAAAEIGAGPYDDHPDALRTIRHGTAVPKTAEGPSVPDGQPKSEQAPIRRPPCARRATAPECAKRFSLWTVHGPFLFWQDKREMGGASPLDKPPCGSRHHRGRRSGGPSTPVFIAHYRPHPAGPHLIPGSPEASSAVPPARPAGFRSASLSGPVSLRVL